MVVDSKAQMTRLEMLCVDTESELSQLDAPVYARDYWEVDEDAPCEFWVAPGRMVDHGWEARVSERR